jgi:hypothetical protein
VSKETGKMINEESHFSTEISSNIDECINIAGTWRNLEAILKMQRIASLSGEAQVSPHKMKRKADIQ